MQNHEQKKKLKKVKIRDSMDKKTSFTAPCLLDLGQFYVGVPQKKWKNEHATCFKQRFTMDSNDV
jgi:hypothetical protein